MSAVTSDPTNENTLICTFGRMNPPTPGHLFIIRRLLSNAIRLGVNEIFVFLSSSQDNKNPLVCDEDQKKHILQNMIHSLKTKMGEEDPSNKDAIIKVRVMIMCCEKSPVVELFGKIYEKTIALTTEQIHIYITLGEDRDSIRFKVDNTVFHKEFLSRPGMESALVDPTVLENPTAVDIGSMSASLVRKLVQEGQKERFESIYSDYLSKPDMAHLYTWIHTGLNKPPKSPKSKSIKRKRDEESPKSKSIKQSPKSKSIKQSPNKKGQNKKGGRKSRKIDFKNKHK